MKIRHRGLHDRTAPNSMTREEFDGIVRDLARILCAMREAMRMSGEKNGVTPPRGFAERILYPSMIGKKTKQSSTSPYSIDEVAQMHLVAMLSHEMSYDEQRRLLFAKHICVALGQMTLSEEELIASIRTFLRRYPKPLHFSGYRPPMPKDD